MPVDHREQKLEEAIEEHLLTHGGYEQGYSNDFERGWGLDKKTLFAFLKESQPQKWKQYQKIHGNKAEDKFLQRLDRISQKQGILHLLRRGLDDYGVHFDLVYFAPATTLNERVNQLYQQNKLKVTRQLYYSKHNKNSLDIVLSVNGLPLVTMELKNQFTDQTVDHAKNQYKNDRDPQELIFEFNRRSLVHFALDTDQVYMTTRLSGDKTYFLPFNQGNNNGAGNPVNPYGYKSSYLWEIILERHSLLDILARFIHLKKDEEFKKGKRYIKETMIFPRFHQLDAVRKMVFDVREYGAGKNYLIQHSTGSGKSMSIAWLAHHLSSLHNKRDDIIFDSVIVITDRQVLDKQLQDVIYEFEQKHGVVKRIEEDSNELATALKRGSKIIITTLHKFGHLLDKVGELPDRNYAIIADEGHRSQSGSLSKSLKKILSVKDLEDNDSLIEDEEERDYQDEIIEDMESLGKKDNLSFFAFTATPKNKTLEKFGTLAEDGNHKPFHLYSMRQAIEEGFILDVLQNYTTYQTYYRVAKMIEDDPELDKKKASRAVARFVALHPHNIAQKTEVMIEHFKRVTKDKIGGKAKAMLVTSSRLSAVRYKKAFDEYIKERGYYDIKTLVAFSGKVKEQITGKEYTERGMNGFKEKELPDKFASDDYQILIVANKYQTGFDQPLLHTMFVDKKLTGITAVQTLSRLNRTCSGKHNTFILDFVNDVETIEKAYQPYYEQTILEESTNPNLLYDLKYKLDDFQIYWNSEIEKFNSVFFKPQSKQRIEDQGLMNSYVDPAVERFINLPEEEQDDFKSTLTTFVRQYAFLSQIIPFRDIELHKLHAYGKFLLKKLPRSESSGAIILDNDVTLEYYRLEMTGEESISLVKEPGVLNPPTHAGTGSRKEEEKALLSEILEIFNDHFGADNFTEADKLFVDQLEEDMMNDEQLGKQAKNNSRDNFKYAFDKEFPRKLYKRMDQNQSIFAKIMNDERFKNDIQDYLLEKVYERFQAEI